MASSPIQPPQLELFEPHHPSQVGDVQPLHIIKRVSTRGGLAGDRRQCSTTTDDSGQSAPEPPGPEPSLIIPKRRNKRGSELSQSMGSVDDNTLQAHITPTRPWQGKNAKLGLWDSY